MPILRPSATKTYTAPEPYIELSFWLPLSPFAPLLSCGAPTATVFPSLLMATPHPA